MHGLLFDCFMPAEAGYAGSSSGGKLIITSISRWYIIKNSCIIRNLVWSQVDKLQVGVLQWTVLVLYQDLLP